jgi:hypothetical protein
VEEEGWGWTGFANVENEPNPPFDVTEREQFRQCDVCGHRDRSSLAKRGNRKGISTGST